MAAIRAPTAARRTPRRKIVECGGGRSVEGQDLCGCEGIQDAIEHRVAPDQGGAIGGGVEVGMAAERLLMEANNAECQIGRAFMLKAGR